MTDLLEAGDKTSSSRLTGSISNGADTPFRGCIDTQADKILVSNFEFLPTVPKCF